MLLKPISKKCEPNLFVLNKIKINIKIVKNNIFWESKCLNQALTAFILLSLYHQDAKFYLGIQKETSNKTTAHAWVISNEKYISGFTRNINKYSIITLIEN